MASATGKHNRPRSIPIRLKSNSELSMNIRRLCDVPSRTGSADKVKVVCGFGDFIEVFSPLDAFHELLNNDELGQTSNSASVLYLCQWSLIAGGVVW